jgi:glycosyltransferase involved in cell wall biosynthesis
MGHEVTLYTEAAQKEWEGMRVVPLREPFYFDDVAIAINEPDLLRRFQQSKRVWECWLNDVTFCSPDFEEHVDLGISPSPAHLDQVLHNTAWHDVHVTPATPRGTHVYDPMKFDWEMIELGCDPEKYPAVDKISGRVVYCSSPDRGLHWLLQEWPKIRRAVPHATLHIFYRLRDWIAGFEGVKYFPPIEALRARALYVAEAIRRMPDMGITVRDSVSRETIEREMAQAEVLAYPCDTTSWSEGFSCTILEACAARACPVITDCDALPSIYKDHALMAERGKWGDWSDLVIKALKEPELRKEWNIKARQRAEQLTWKRHAEQLMAAIRTRL